NERWSKAQIYDPESSAPGKAISKWGAYIEDVDHFDNEFFNISAEEAERIDPQQRLILELTWEALENAGINPQALSGENIGVYMGVSHSDYERITYRELEGVVGYDGPGLYHSIVANRVSYFFNFTGPSIVVDSACSSSLSALQVAFRALRFGDVEIAIVGGVNLNLTPEETIGLSKANLLSPTGTSAPFSNESNGFVKGEGAGVIVLCTHELAKQQNKTALCEILAACINQDGRSNGILAPSGNQQRSLIKQTLEQAQVARGDIDYVEAHGTSTFIGDLIEYKALDSIYGDHESRTQKCIIGSLKANIGHLEAASGIASLIKVILCLQHDIIPAQINCETPNRFIKLDKTGLSILSEAHAWKQKAACRIAALSAMGFGGSNAHVILREVKAPREEPALTPRPYNLVVLSAHNSAALKKRVKDISDWLNENPACNGTELCMNLNLGKGVFDYRIAFSFQNIPDLKAQLETFCESGDTEPMRTKAWCWNLSFKQELQLDEIALIQQEPMFSSVLPEVREALTTIHLSGRTSKRNAPLDLMQLWPKLDAATKSYLSAFVYYRTLEASGIVPKFIIASEEDLNLALNLKKQRSLLDALRSVHKAANNGQNLTFETSEVKSTDTIIDRQSFIKLNNDKGPFSVHSLVPIDALGAHRVGEDLQGAPFVARMLQDIGSFFVSGLDIDFHQVYRGQSFKTMDLPTFPFQRRSFWVRSVVDQSEAARYPTYKSSIGVDTIL
ncbi:MAG: polyketide synthase, partial [Bacteroidota bacterium]